MAEKYTPYRTHKDIRTVVKAVLDRAGVKRPPVPVEKVAASLGATVKYSPFEGELCGMLVRRGDGEVLIGVNSAHHPNRQRFTIAHECGHLKLHEGEAFVDKNFPLSVNWRDDVSSRATDPQEIEANRFAAELLMPFDFIVADLRQQNFDIESEEGVKPLAKKYLVSVQAMTHRVANIAEELLGRRV